MRLLQYQDSSMRIVFVEGRRIRRVKGACVRVVKHGDVSFEPRLNATTEWSMFEANGQIANSANHQSRLTLLAICPKWRLSKKKGTSCRYYYIITAVGNPSGEQQMRNFRPT
jgi:hypothetical protein